MSELKNRKGEAADWSDKIDDSQDHEIKYRLTGWAQKNCPRWTADDSVPIGYGTVTSASMMNGYP